MNRLIGDLLEVSLIETEHLRIERSRLSARRYNHIAAAPAASSFPDTRPGDGIFRSWHGAHNAPHARSPAREAGGSGVTDSTRCLRRVAYAAVSNVGTVGCQFDCVTKPDTGGVQWSV